VAVVAVAVAVLAVAVTAVVVVVAAADLDFTTECKRAQRSYLTPTLAPTSALPTRGHSLRRPLTQLAIHEPGFS
jgi:hypothetical protein